MSDLTKRRVDQGPKAASKPKFEGANGSRSKHEDDLVDVFFDKADLSGSKTMKGSMNWIAKRIVSKKNPVKLTFWMAQLHREQNIS